MNTYLITGATGYIGSMLIKHLRKTDHDCRITALVRNRQKAQEMFPDGITILQTDLSDRTAMRDLKINCSFLIHCASVTKSAEMVSHPVEVTESIVNVTQNVLGLARRCGVKSMVYLSSMEVYGDIDCSDGHRVTETEAGNIETLHVRSCYPLGKRMAENICYSYYKEYGVPVKIARLAQTFGRGVPPEDNRVFARFARAAKAGKDIILHTTGASMGNYCGIDDAVSGILFILEHGRDGEAYNVVNEENTMTIREMAMLAAERIAGKKIKVIYDIPNDNRYGYAADTGLRLSGKKLSALGWQPIQSLTEMYLDVLEDI